MLSKALTVVSFRILTALLCLVTVPVACFLCVCPAFGILAKKKNIYIKKKKKKKVKKVKRKKSGKHESHAPRPAPRDLCPCSCVSSEHRQMRQAIIPCVTRGAAPLLRGVCVGSILSSAAAPLHPPDTGLPSGTFVTCHANEGPPP